MSAKLLLVGMYAASDSDTASTITTLFRAHGVEWQTTWPSEIPLVDMIGTLERWAALPLKLPTFTIPQEYSSQYTAPGDTRRTQIRFRAVTVGERMELGRAPVPEGYV